MVNGAPGSAWASVRAVAGGVEELQLLGSPAHDDPAPLEPRQPCLDSGDFVHSNGKGAQ